MGTDNQDQGKDSLSDYLRKEFDNKIKEIKKNNHLYPFSTNTLLRDLFDSGITPLESLDVLEEIKPHLYQGMTTQKLVQLINQALNKLDIENDFIKGTYLQPILIEFENNDTIVFNYRAIKDYLSEQLNDYRYSSKTLRAITEELHRIVLSLRTNKIRAHVIQNMVPSVLRNVIGFNPFSSKRLDNDYHTILKLNEVIEKTWRVLPDDEKQEIIISFFESLYRIILIKYNYLPGHNTRSTIYQINQLIAELSQKEHSSLSDKEIYLLGKSSRQVNDLLENKQEDLLKLNMWRETLNVLNELVKSLMKKGTIVWLILIDQSGNELYSKFSNKNDTKHKALLGMAISGVQSLVNELTDKSIREIEQDEGSILIERRQQFSIIAMVNPVTPVIRQKLVKLADFVTNELREDIANFNGNVNRFYELLDTYLDREFDKEFKTLESS